MSLIPFGPSRRYLYLVHANGSHGPPFSAPSPKPPLRSISTSSHKPLSPLSITSPPGFSTMTADRPSLYKSASGSTLRQAPADASASGSRTPSECGDTDLNVEVAALSNKLINAINHQTQLDDSLSQTKHELQLSKARVKQLEAVAKEHADMLAQGLLVDKKYVETETQQLMGRLKEESRQRGKAEKDKRNIEQELEGLTAALFSEANKMVSAARMERDAMDRKNEQLRSQLADTEILLVSHQEQLAELKKVMQQMNAEREDADTSMSTGTPSTPALGNRASKESLGRGFEVLHLPPNSAAAEDIQPCEPTALTNLIHPVLRHDIASYQDFCEVLHAPKVTRTSPIPRLSSGSFSSIQAMGMGIGISYNSSPSSSPTGLSGSLFGARGDKGGDSNPSPATSGSAANGNTQQQAGLPLKDTKFYKRVLVEDIEPTLRLDLAPGLSWLARRNVLSAVTDGSLQIDPLDTSAKAGVLSCSLCGENRSGDQYARTHRMRTSDNSNAQRYPLCTHCVTRTRSVCDIMAFLRTLKEGMWKCENEGDEKHAWEESVKLRERMFWCRIGGGVIPAFIQRESARNSEEHLRPVGYDASCDVQPPRIKGYGVPMKLEVPKKRISKELPPIVPERPISESPSPIDKELPPPPSALGPVEDTEARAGGSTVEKNEPPQAVDDPEDAPVVSAPIAPTAFMESESPIVEIAKAPESNSRSFEKNKSIFESISTPRSVSGRLMRYRELGK